MNGSLLSPPASLSRPMTDPFGRTISYLRVSVTDRCDLRCFYCMSEDMTFLPKADLLTLEELDRLCSAFIAKGVRKLRLTGGEPLVRRNVMSLVRSLSRHLKTGALNELTLTTNGSQLARFAGELADCGVRRINVSMDTLDPAKFRAITRWGDLDKVLGGIEAARAASIPPSTLSRSPQRVMARNFAGSSVSIDTLMRRTPQSASSPAKRASCEPLVVSVSSLSAPVSRWRESERTSDITLRRTSGSPPVSRSLRTPLAMKAEHSRSSSSSVRRSALGRNVMSSDMQ